MNILELDIGHPIIKLDISLSHKCTHVQTLLPFFTHLCNINNILVSIFPDSQCQTRL